MMRRGRAMRGARCILALVAAACPAGDEPDARRDVDTVPVRSSLATPLPPGRAEAFFRLDTGGDQMTQRDREAGLMFIVRVGVDEYRQTIASCRNPGLGTALGGGTERELEVAHCAGEFWLISEPGAVSVRRMDRKPEGEQVARFVLPDSTRAVKPTPR